MRCNLLLWMSQEASFPWCGADSLSILWRGTIGAGGQSLCWAPESASALEERAGGTDWPSRRLQTHSHNGLRSYLAPLGSRRGAQSWVWKFGLKSGFISLSERTGGLLTADWRGNRLRQSAGKQGSGERATVPDEWDQTVAEPTWADINNRALGWATSTPPPTSRGFVNITACSCSACDSPRMYESSLTCTRKYYSYSALCNMPPPIMLYCTVLKH